MFRLGRKAQSTVEYAILFSIVLAALTAMQLYVRRGLQARMKDVADKAPGIIAKEADASLSTLFSADTQYDPYYYRQQTSNLTTTTSVGTEEGVSADTGGQRLLTDRSRAQKGKQGYVEEEPD